jgi:hypothetical protein
MDFTYINKFAANPVFGFRRERDREGCTMSFVQCYKKESVWLNHHHHDWNFYDRPNLLGEIASFVELRSFFAFSSKVMQDFSVLVQGKVHTLQPSLFLNLTRCVEVADELHPHCFHGDDDGEVILRQKHLLIRSRKRNSRFSRQVKKETVIVS